MLKYLLIRCRHQHSPITLKMRNQAVSISSTCLTAPINSPLHLPIITGSLPARGRTANWFLSVSADHGQYSAVALYLNWQIKLCINWSILPVLVIIIIHHTCNVLYLKIWIMISVNWIYNDDTGSAWGVSLSWSWFVPFMLNNFPK